MTTQHERIHVYAMYRYRYMQRMFTTGVCMHVYICNVPVVISIKNLKLSLTFKNTGAWVSHIWKREIYTVEALTPLPLEW